MDPRIAGLPNAKCPRCGGGFHCGANDPTPCACMTIALDAMALAHLHERYEGCLCLRCLGEIEAESAGRGQSRPWPPPPRAP